MNPIVEPASVTVLVRAQVANNRTHHSARPDRLGLQFKLDAGLTGTSIRLYGRSLKVTK
jgi:hypothetical protein